MVLSRARSLRAAAAELGISPSALSRRLQGLEHALGAQLFDRSAGAMKLSPAGRQFVEEIGPAMEALRQAAARLQGQDEPVRLAASHSMSAEWVLPRIAALHAETGQIVKVIAGKPLDSLREGRADLAIAGGLKPEGLDAAPLVNGEAALVAAPKLANGRCPPRTVTGFADCPRLTVSGSLDPWQDWLSGLDVNPQRLAAPMIFDTWHLALEGSANGLGAVLAFPLVSERFLASGRLAPCFQSRRPVRGQYWLIRASRLNRRRASRAKHVADWIANAAAASQAAFRDLVERVH